MKIYSFYKSGIELKPLEVEVSLMKGLPQFQFIGLPDTAIRESELRIRSALKKQNFEIPKGQQVLVNLKPLHIKKSSRGLELAVAAAFLWLTGQAPQPSRPNGSVYVYGELGLDGRVFLPDDLDSLVDHPKEKAIWSGVPENPVGYDIQGISTLSELVEPQRIEGKDFYLEMNPPEMLPMSFSKQAAQIIEIVGAGEHSIMLAGPAGSGKTTLAACIHNVLINPSPKEFLMSQRIGKLVGQPHDWRPLVAPHHTTPPLSMVGGGSPPFPGEITRAHGGTLIMDEFLEFPTKVREALREPIEKGEIVVSRRGQLQKYPAQFLLIGTTNLCPCGDLVPGRNTLCRYSLTKCRSYLERLSGPLLDRFQTLSYSHTWTQKPEVSLKEVSEKVKRARDFALAQRGQEIPNGRMDENDLAQYVDPFVLEELLPERSSSRRRYKSIIRVARTAADLDQEKLVQGRHLERAIQLSWLPFESMKRIFS